MTVHTDEYHNQNGKKEDPRDSRVADDLQEQIVRMRGGIAKGVKYED